jgi:hypothetical protein
VTIDITELSRRETNNLRIHLTLHGRIVSAPQTHQTWVAFENGHSLERIPHTIWNDLHNLDKRCTAAKDCKWILHMLILAGAPL